METLILRTPLGDSEISERRHALDRWQRTALIVIGKGKQLSELHHELRKMPERLETILHALTEKGLIKPDLELSLPQPIEAITKTTPPLREVRRYLAYLIGMIENADATTALSLTITLKKATTPDDIAALYPVFHESLRKICDADEAQRLLGKIDTLDVN
jgi:hypothetical protein